MTVLNQKFTTPVLLVLILFSAWPILAEPAQVLKAAKLPGYLAYGKAHPEYFSDGHFTRAHEFLNQSTIIYVASSAREQDVACTDQESGRAIDHKIYAYDLNSQTSMLLSTLCFL